MSVCVWVCVRVCVSSSKDRARPRMLGRACVCVCACIPDLEGGSVVGQDEELLPLSLCHPRYLLDKLDLVSVCVSVS